MIDSLKIKEKFPILSQEVNGKRLVYLDSAATSQKPIDVINSITQYYKTCNSNIHRGIHSLAQQSTDLYEKTRSHVARFINAKSSDEIVFTRNTTESINLVAYTWGEKNINQGDEIILSIMEHHSNLIPWQELAKRKGAVIKIVPITKDLLFDYRSFESMLSEKTKLVAITGMSNVTGVITPISEIIKKSHAVGARVLIDGAQRIAHMKIDVQADDIDFLAFSSHKMLGPTGVGVLYGKKELLNEMPPFLFGGDMVDIVGLTESKYKESPYRFEAGTPNIADVVAFDTSLSFLDEIGMDNVEMYIKELMDYAKKILGKYSFVRILTPESSESASGVLSFTIDGVHPHDIASIFDNEGVAIRAGMHCAHPLTEALGVASTARLSFYIYNTLEDIDVAEYALKKVAEIFNLG